MIVRKLTSSTCFYCGAKPLLVSIAPKTLRRKLSSYKYNGIDRVNSDLGYTIQNTVPCCHICNKAKLAYSLQEFKDWVNRVYNHRIKK